MIERINVIRNVGQFLSTTSGNGFPLSRLTLIYAENGRGKTTLAAIVRSLGRNAPEIIAERARFGATHRPHVVMQKDGTTVSFNDNSWDQVVPNIVVFDDEFVSQNVYSGLLVEAGQRQNLHGLILGSQGVTLANLLQQLVEKIEEHNAALRQRREAIPEKIRRGLSVEEFCALPEQKDIGQLIQEVERKLAASRERTRIATAPLFESLALPNINVDEINAILAKDIPSLDREAISQVQRHLAHVGTGGEAWVSEGMKCLTNNDLEACPFCGQELSQAPIIEYYRIYFSRAYADLKEQVTAVIQSLETSHGGNQIASFERMVRVAVERQTLWSQFVDVSAISIDTETIARDWETARQLLRKTLTDKLASPLDPIVLNSETLAAISTYEKHDRLVADVNERINTANAKIVELRQNATSNDAGRLSSEANRLNAIKDRHTPEISALCEDYLNEASAKKQTEQERNNVRDALKAYSEDVFPKYQRTVNAYLEKFNVGFHLDRLSPTQVRNGSTCTYNIVVNNTPVPVTTGEPGQPSFRTVLSAGDRNALALAFFLSSIDEDPGREDKIIVIDDPVSSLDDHRGVRTIQEIRHLSDNVQQVIVLSHTKGFLAGISERADSSTTSALRIKRDGSGSALAEWAVEQDAYTEHDRDHERLRNYIHGETDASRDVAAAIRFVLERYFRVAYPDQFPPGLTLGPFVDKCRRKVGTSDEILSPEDTRELDDLKEYANRFHHDTNPAWRSAQVNDAELVGYVRRVLHFTRRPVGIGGAISTGS